MLGLGLVLPLALFHAPAQACRGKLDWPKSADDPSLKPSDVIVRVVFKRQISSGSFGGDGEPARPLIDTDTVYQVAVTDVLSGTSSDWMKKQEVLIFAAHNMCGFPHPGDVKPDTEGVLILRHLIEPGALMWLVGIVRGPGARS
jgi:hypothetical protein